MIGQLGLRRLLMRSGTGLAETEAASANAAVAMENFILVVLVV